MIADEHALLEERRVRAGVAELAAQAIAHMIDLQEDCTKHKTLIDCGQIRRGTYLAARLHVRVVARGASCAREGRLWHLLGGHAGILALREADSIEEADFVTEFFLVIWRFDSRRTFARPG